MRKLKKILTVKQYIDLFIYWCLIFSNFVYAFVKSMNFCLLRKNWEFTLDPSVYTFLCQFVCLHDWFSIHPFSFLFVFTLSSRKSWFVTSDHLPFPRLHLSSVLTGLRECNYPSSFKLSSPTSFFYFHSLFYNFLFFTRMYTQKMAKMETRNRKFEIRQTKLLIYDTSWKKQSMELLLCDWSRQRVEIGLLCNV